MSAFETASKLIVEEIDRGGLHHVPSLFQSGRLKLLSVVEDGNIKEWKNEDLQFEIETEVYTLCTLKRNFTKLNTKDGILGAELKGVFGCDSTIGSKVSFNAEFKELAWRKLKNVDSLVKYLENGQLPISKKSGFVDKFREFFGSSRSFKIIISVVYTTTPTEITRTYEHKAGASATVDSTLSPTVESEARIERSKYHTQVVCLPSGTLIAYGYLDVFVCENGSMKVKDEDVLRAKVQPSSSSAADASSAEKIKELEQKCAEIEAELKREQEGRQERTANKEERDKSVKRNATLETNLKVCCEEIGRLGREVRYEKKKYANDMEQVEVYMEQVEVYMEQVEVYVEQVEVLFEDLKEELDSLKQQVMATTSASSTLNLETGKRE